MILDIPFFPTIHEVDRKIIVVKDAVKEVGSYKAIVKLHKEVSVEIPFEVVAE